VNAYKETLTGNDSTSEKLYLQVRVYQRATGIGVSGLTVVVLVQSDRGLEAITLVTGANGFQTDCGSHSYALNDQITVGTQAVANPPGGVPAPGLGSVTVQTTGSRSFCN
jgi:hypothetical protein